MNRSTLRERVRTISGIEMTSLRSDAAVNEVINDVYREILAAAKWPFLLAMETFETVAGVPAYAVPAAVDRVRTVTIEGVTDHPAGLHQVSQRWYDRNVDHTQRGVPEVYTLGHDGTTARVAMAPTPADVYTVQVRGWAKAEKLADDADVPVFDDRFHVAIAYGAAAVLLDEEGQLDRAERAAGRAGVHLNDMREHYMTSSDDEPVVIGGGVGGAAPARWRGRLWPGRA